MNWEVIGSVAATLGLGYTMFRNLKSDIKQKFSEQAAHFDEKIEDDLAQIESKMNSRFETINARFDRVEEWASERFDAIDMELGKMDAKIEDKFKKLDEKISNIKVDVDYLRECMAFLEAANIYTMPIEPMQPNARSQAAKDMWARRRQKRLEKKDG